MMETQSFAVVKAGYKSILLRKGGKQAVRSGILRYKFCHFLSKLVRKTHYRKKFLLLRQKRVNKRIGKHFVYV